MKILSRETFAKSKAYIQANCSPLTRHLFAHAFEGGDYQGVIQALSAFQNPDGGFGHNLEGDFMLPASSPTATSVGFHILSELGATAQEPLVQKGIAYLLSSFKPERKGWIPVPPEVNQYPHASWWHYLDAEGGSVIDRNWGNPTAELVGYLVQYRSLVPPDFLEPLYQHTLGYLRNSGDSMEMHELACFLRLAERMPQDDFLAVKDKLTKLVLNTVATDPQAWRGYSAHPLNFVSSPESFLYPPLAEAVRAYLDFLVESIQPDGTWTPPWSWNGYEAEWQKARIEIIGRLTIATLKTLQRFGKIEQD